MHPSVVAGPPAQFSPIEIADFAALVTAGGEVLTLGLPQRVSNAHCLGFMRVDRCLVGVAGLKKPNDGYRERIQGASGIALGALPYELGWIFIMPSARGGKLSYPLCEPVIAAAGTSGVFATSRADNVGMHRTLTRLGFAQQGAAWPSKQNDGDLLLFIRPPS